MCMSHFTVISLVPRTKPDANMYSKIISSKTCKNHSGNCHLSEFSLSSIETMGS